MSCTECVSVCNLQLVGDIDRGGRAPMIKINTGELRQGKFRGVKYVKWNWHMEMSHSNTVTVANQALNLRISS